MRIVLVGWVAALVITGCGTPSNSATSSTATARPSPATASASPAPDVQRIDLVSSGVGAYMLVAIPVAIVHNAATRTAATGVTVHFDLKRGGNRVFALDSPAVMILPGETLVIAATCTDTCNNADGVDPTVAVTRWVKVGGQPIAVDPGVYSCGAGCNGHGYGSVATTLHGPALAQNTPLNVFAACTDSAGTIIGGGQRQLTWPQNGGSLALVVPVILSGSPAACLASASPPSTRLG